MHRDLKLENILVQTNPDNGHLQIKVSVLLPTSSHLISVQFLVMSETSQDKLAQLVKILNLRSVNGRFKFYNQQGVFSYGPLTSLSLHIPSVASGHRSKNNGGPNQ